MNKEIVLRLLYVNQQSGQDLYKQKAKQHKPRRQKIRLGKTEARVSHGVLKTFSPYITPYVYSDRLLGYNGLTAEVQSTSHSQRTQTELKLTKNREENRVVFGCL